MRHAVDFDVVIAGGGPAGTSVAKTLLKYSSLSVALAQRANSQQYGHGELIRPELAATLHFLGVWERFTELELACDEFMEQAFVPRTGTIGTTAGWPVDRRRFDKMLLDDVKRAGAEVFNCAILRGATFDAQVARWRVFLDEGSNRREVTARFLVDASGRCARIARSLKATFVADDELIAVSAQYRGWHANFQSLVLEVDALGWWYAINVRSGIVVTLNTDIQNFRDRRLRDRLEWQRIVRSQPAFRWLTRSSQFVGFEVCHVPSRRLSRSTGNQWIAVGDAAMSADPIAGLGIGFAMMSGANAARVIEATLRGNDAPRATYERSINRIFAEYRRKRQQWYVRQASVLQSSFWRARRVSTNPQGT